MIVASAGIDETWKVNTGDALLLTTDHQGATRSVRLFNQSNVEAHVVLATIRYEEVPRQEPRAHPSFPRMRESSPASLYGSPPSRGDDKIDSPRFTCSHKHVSIMATSSLFTLDTTIRVKRTNLDLHHVQEAGIGILWYRGGGR